MGETLLAVPMSVHVGGVSDVMCSEVGVTNYNAAETTPRAETFASQEIVASFRGLPCFYLQFAFTKKQQLKQHNHH